MGGFPRCTVHNAWHLPNSSWPMTNLAMEAMEDFQTICHGGFAVFSGL